MIKINMDGLLWALLGVGLMCLSNNALATDTRMQHLLEATKQSFASNNIPSAHDILGDNDNITADTLNNGTQSAVNDPDEEVAENNAVDNSENDSANDYDSNKESESEDAAPTPQEEEDSPLLDEEGNVVNQEQRGLKNQQEQQNQMNPLNPPTMPNQYIDNNDK